jgi:hypothetical protein
MAGLINIIKDMKKSTLFMTMLAVVFMIAGCASDGMPIYRPGSSQTDTSDEDEGSGNGTVTPPPAVAEPDYGRLTAANHPRIIFTSDDFAKIAQAGTANAALKIVHDIIINQANSTVGKADLTYTLSGKRLLSVSRDAQQRILSCAYAYKTTGEQKYLTQAEHDINTVCDFQDWNAAKHWLDVGEMATGVALGYDWLYDGLSEDTKAKVVQKLKDYCFTPANNQQWNLNFYESEGNWNQVCNGGIIASALAIYEKDAALCKSMIEKSITTNGPAIEAMYAPDGNYPEGYSYWNYGTLYQALINTMLYTSTGSDAGLSQKEGFSKTGKYMLFMEGPAKKCFNYSDCAPGVTPCIAQWYFAWKYDDLSHLYLEKSRLGSYSGSAEARLMPLIAWYAYKMDISSLDDITAPAEKVWRGNGKTPVLLAHGNWAMDATDKFLGIKGGKASTSHAHMDAGSFVYDYAGVRWSADMGLQSYGTLEPYVDLWNMNDGSQRWNVFRYQNTSHSTITINDAPHRVGGMAEIKAVINDGTKLGGIVDMSAAVSNQAERVVRTIYMKGNDLYVEDEITARSDKDAKVRWTMVTLAKPVIEYGNITLEAGGKYLYMKKSSSSMHNPVWKTWTTVSPNSYDAANTGYYMCGYEVTVTKGTAANITIRLTPEE